MNASSLRKPLVLHKKDPVSHKTKEDIKNLEEAEVTMGTVNFTPPEAVKNNLEAMKKWAEITKIYVSSKLLLVTSTDNGVLARYCLLYADYYELVEQRKIVSSSEYSEDLASEMRDEIDEELPKRKANKIWKIFEFYNSLDGVIKIDKMIDSKLKSILQIEDRIFLNPAAKVRTIPLKKKVEKKSDLESKGFNV